MAKSFDSYFVDEVKRIFRARVVQKDVQAVPLPKEAGGTLDAELLDTTQGMESYLGSMHNCIAKKGFFRPKELAPNEISQEGYDMLAQVVNTQGVTPQLEEVVTALAEQNKIGKELVTDLLGGIENLKRLLSQDTKKWYVSGKDLYQIKGIPEDIPYYNQLNGELVFKPPVGVKVEKRVYSVLKGDFKRDADGNYITETVTKGTGSIYICTPKSLQLPYNYKSKAGYTYVDFYRDSNNKKVFVYAIPKRFVYPIQQLALVITKRTQIKAFEMVPYNTWMYGKVALCLIPYNPKEHYELHSTKVLATAYGYDVDSVYEKNFKDKVDKIISVWIKSNVIGKPEDFEMEDDWGESMNLIIDQSKVALKKSEYKGISDKNLIEQNEEAMRSNDVFEESELGEPKSKSEDDIDDFFGDGDDDDDDWGWL